MPSYVKKAKAVNGAPFVPGAKRFSNCRGCDKQYKNYDSGHPSSEFQEHELECDKIKRKSEYDCVNNLSVIHFHRQISRGVFRLKSCLFALLTLVPHLASLRRRHAQVQPLQAIILLATHLQTAFERSAQLSGRHQVLSAAEAHTALAAATC